MRRYFMDVAQREGDAVLLEQLRAAPDNNFKPGSAGDAHELARRSKRDNVTTPIAVAMDTSAAVSTPAATTGYYSPVQRRTPVNQRLQKSRLLTRSKSMSVRNELFDEKSQIKDLDKLNKLKEIYMKQKETHSNSKLAQKEAAEKAKSRSTTVLDKMRQGSDEIEGVRVHETGFRLLFVCAH